MGSAGVRNPILYKFNNFLHLAIDLNFWPPGSQFLKMPTVVLVRWLLSKSTLKSLLLWGKRINVCSSLEAKWRFNLSSTGSSMSIFHPWWVTENPFPVLSKTVSDLRLLVLWTNQELFSEGWTWPKIEKNHFTDVCLVWNGQNYQTNVLGSTGHKPFEI